MRKIIFLFLLLCSIDVIAQDADEPLALPDSLAGRLREFRRADFARAEALDATIMFYLDADRILDAQGYINELSSLANDLNDNYYLSVSDYYRGLCKLEMYHYGEAISILDNALRRAELLLLTDKTRVLTARIQLARSSYFFALSAYPDSFEALNKGLEVIDNSNDVIKSRLLNNLGNIYANTENSRKALDSYSEALSIYPVMVYLYNTATVYCDLGRYDSAMIYIDSAYQKSSSLSDTLRIKQLEGVVRQRLGDREGSIRCYEDCLSSIPYCHDDEIVITVLLNGASMALLNEDYPKAAQLVDQAIDVAHRLKNENMIMDCLRLKAIVMRQLGDYENGLNCLLKYDSIRDAMMEHQNRDRVNESIRRQESERLERQFEAERREARLRQRFAGIIALLAVVLVGSIIFFWVRNKRQREALLKKELDLRNREVTSKTMSQMQTNEVLNEVIEKLTHLSNNPKGTGNPLPMAIRELKSRVDDGAKTDFDYYFVQVHPDFYAHLKKDFPDLSQNELRLCALIRANLNIKEIANLNNVSIDSVKSSRKRLRKSLGIHDSKVDLVDFLSKY
jgi:tetratricopeptide (TPR) repeat protein/DNA-binding NarL/FixJ family response regulator